MEIAKKITIILALVLAFATFSVIAFAEQKEETQKEQLTASAQVATSSANLTFATCMKSAVQAKKEAFDLAKSTRAACVDAGKATNQTDGAKAIGKSCNSDYKKSMKDAKSAFVQARKECKQLPHTSWEGFKANFQ